MPSEEDTQIPLLSKYDEWQKAVKVLTGYDAPLIEDVFTDKLIGNQDIPLMYVEIETMDKVEVVDASETAWIGENSLFDVNTLDITIPFYNDIDGEVKYQKVKIRLLGDRDSGYAPVGGVKAGSEGKLPDTDENTEGTSWDTYALNRYAYGTGRALEALFRHEHGTKGFAWGGDGVGIEDTVDLSTFETAALAFDHVQNFVNGRMNELHGWEKILGTYENDNWRGYAAGVWWELVHLLVRRYERLAEDMENTSGKSFGSKQGAAIRHAGDVVREEAQKLHNVWVTWANERSNPLRWLSDILAQIMDYVWDFNITKISYHDAEFGNPSAHANAGANGEGATGNNYTTDPGFSDEAVNEFGNSYGPLDSMSTWKKVGGAARQRWWNDVRETLGTAAEDAMRNVQRAWADAGLDIGEIRPPRADDLEAAFKEDKAYKDQKDAQDKQDDIAEQNQKNIDDMNAANEKARQDAEEDAAKAKAAADAQREEDLRRQEEEQRRQDEIRKAQEAKADAQREEDLRRQEAERERQDQIRKEQEAEQERQQKEQEAKQEEQEREAEQEQKEQEAKQEEQEREAERDQAEQERKAEQQQKEQEAKQEEYQRRQEQMQLHQMAQQRAIQEQQRKEQEKQQKEQEAKQAEQEREAEQQQKEQEAKQAEQEREADREQAEQEAKQEQQQKEQEKEQAEQEREAEQQQKEQEAKQEQQQKEQEAKQAEQEREAEQQQKEQEAKQEEYQRRQEEQQKEYQEQQLNLQREQQQQAEDLVQDQNEITGPVNGDDSLTNPGGSDSHLDEHGRVVTEYPDGSTTTIDPQTQTVTVTNPDGSTSSGPLNSGDVFTNPDDSVSHLDSQGEVVTEYPDGSTTTVDPQTGATTLTSPDGTTTSGYLNGGPGSELPGSGSQGDYEGSQVGGVNDLGSFNGAQTPEEELYDPKNGGSNGQEGSGIGAPPPSTQGVGGSPGGMPLNQGMGPGRGGGGDGGPSERTRNVIDGGEVVSNRRRPAAARAGNGRYDEREAVIHTSGGTPFVPPMAGAGGGQGEQNRQQTESGDRERDVWAPEDEDVWGSDEGGAPAVIGR
ncbi:AAWKG family protein [Streptomyces sp. NPDC051963]|uniref:AAWKG family protein n=1 Tax=Streptomyces sp. NPDC051963 TaxID=3365678 RepID=UPI0037D1F28E